MMYNLLNQGKEVRLVWQAENKSLSERIATELYNIVVLQKKFAPGDKLPNENDLSQQLGVSRTTLREAVRYLVAQGVLSVQRGRGTFISEDLSIFNKYDVGTLSHARLGDMYEIRLMFEPQCSMLACFRATEDELQNIFEQAQYVEKLVLEDGACRTKTRSSMKCLPPLPTTSSSSACSQLSTRR
jgi:DNA-binding FadR family transcriptional regulator